jgi:hypothetical protein
VEISERIDDACKGVQIGSFHAPAIRTKQVRKSFLALLAPFQFCHSREGGNPIAAVRRNAHGIPAFAGMTEGLVSLNLNAKSKDFCGPA